MACDSSSCKSYFDTPMDLDHCYFNSNTASVAFQFAADSPAPTSSCSSGEAACNGIAEVKVCRGPGGSQLKYCLPGCPAGRAQVECLGQNVVGAECKCGSGDLLCPEGSFCSISTSFQGQACAAAKDSPEGCQYCCPSFGRPVTDLGCLAPFCECAGETPSPGNDENCLSGNPPFSNWPAHSGASGCTAGGEFSFCPEFVYLEYNTTSDTWDPVTKIGKKVECIHAVTSVKTVCGFPSEMR